MAKICFMDRIRYSKDIEGRERRNCPTHISAITAQHDSDLILADKKKEMALGATCSYF